MATLNRILSTRPIESLDDYIESVGTPAIRTAVEMSPEALVEVIEASGLRGRGGGGFPTGTKWRTVAEMSADAPSSVVVNGAEGEPGSFKDRTLIRNNPYQVIDGALVAARAVGATEVVIAVKEEFTEEIDRLTRAIAEFQAGGLSDVSVRLATGPTSYLFGEESALLEVVEGRPPLPRVNPPYRRGLSHDADDANSSSDLALSGDDGDVGAPALVNNVETLANVAFILREGVDEFRSIGTPASPGTTVCTISGAVDHAGVAELAMGTPLWDAIDAIGGGALPERTLIGAVSGTANAVITADDFDTPLCFDAMRDAGSGLGASGFIVFDDQTDLAAVAHGVARFLAIESCGQCEPCKIDGGAIADRLDVIRRSDEHAPADLDEEIATLMSTVADGARCGLASQHQTAVASLHELATTANRSHLDGSLPAADVSLIAPIVDIVDGTAELDRRHLDKQRYWSTDGTDSGTAPADRLQTS